MKSEIKLLFILKISFVIAFAAFIASGIIYTPSQKSDPQISAADCSSSQTVVIDFCQKAKSGDFSELDNLITKYSDISAFISKRPEKKDLPFASKKTKTESIDEIPWDADGKLLNEGTAKLYYGFVKDFSKFIYDRQFNIVESKIHQPKENQVRVCVSFSSDNVKSGFSVSDFYLVRKKGESWKIFRIDMRPPTETKCEN